MTPVETPASAIQKMLAGMSDFILEYAIALAALGALTMAIQEAVKKLLRILRKFHRTAVESWLEVDGVGARSHYRVSATAEEEVSPYPDDRRRSDAYDELLHLTTGLAMHHDLLRRNSPVESSRHIANALFELELPQMMSQIQDAADTALNNPQRYPALYGFLTRGCATDDVDRWATAMSRDAENETQGRAKELTDVYGRVRLLVKRQLDSFQTVTSYRWREGNQLCAVVLGAVLMFAAQVWSTRTEPSHDWVNMTLISVLGGMLAPIAKDLVDALGNMKSK